MTDEAKRLVDALREDAEWARANEWETPITLGDNLTAAADMIEKLSADRDAWKRRSEAAERDINKIIELYPCAVCKHWYLGGCVLADNLDEPHWKWSGAGRARRTEVRIVKTHHSKTCENCLWHWPSLTPGEDGVYRCYQPCPARQSSPAARRSWSSTASALCAHSPRTP